jgi:hypothetical protein
MISRLNIMFGPTDAGNREEFVKENEDYIAAIETGLFFDSAPRLPVTFEVTCDQLKAACTVLPSDEPCARKLLLS